MDEQLKGLLMGGSTGDADVDAILRKIRPLLDQKADRAELEQTRNDFGLWFKKIKEELERKLNRDELQGFEQRLIEILSNSFADKNLNDSDHAKIFKKLNKLYTMIREQGPGQNPATGTITPIRSSCLACERKVVQVVRHTRNKAESPLKVLNTESNRTIGTSKKAYHLGGGFYVDPYSGYPDANPMFNY